jgi:hypothetical protein
MVGHLSFVLTAMVPNPGELFKFFFPNGPASIVHVSIDKEKVFRF